ncbi:MAG: class I SAM-dependent RNA methyltransferase [Cellvibrionaceae bacterium]
MRNSSSSKGRQRRPFSKKKKTSTPHFVKGPVFSATVRDLTSDGQGIVSDPEGLTVFVPGVWINETGQFRVVGKQKKIGIGELVELEKPSPHRVKAICSHHGFSDKHCGGCAWQFMAYSSQLEAKQFKVERSIARLSSCKVSPIKAAPDTDGYRNRAQLKSDGKNIGYIAKSSNSLAPITDCPILSSHNRNTLSELIAKLPNNDWKPKRHEQWTTLNINENVFTENISINKRLPFQQSNNKQNKFMREWLGKELSKLDKKSKILELFCGSGNFTDIIIENGFTNISAIDSAGDAIEELQNKHENINAVSMNLFLDNVFLDIYKKYGKFDTLILDPPREGLKNHENLISKKRYFKDIFYISCDLATFCRDTKYFLENGYTLSTLQPLDQSPHTPHIELLSHFFRK